MFDRMIRELRALGRTTEVSVPIQCDSEGYLDRECPAETCTFLFKVHEDDWRDLVRDEEVFCPMCRHAAHSKSWFTTSQVEHARKHAIAQVQNRLSKAMRDDAHAWNARQKPGLLRITMDVRASGRSILLPVAAGEPMRLKATCESCKCRYSYIGSAFFCPACGHNSAAQTFRQTLTAVRTISRIGPKLRESLSVDDAEVAARALREKGVGDVVMALQRLAERIWESLPGTETPRRNVFQRLDEASKLWGAATGQEFTAFLSDDELCRLRIGYQRRHLLAHCEGVVDEDYVRKSGDAAFTLGQRVTVNDAFLLDFVDLAEKLGRGLLTAFPSDGTHASVVSEPMIPPAPAQYEPTITRRPSGYSVEAETVAKLLITRSQHGRPGDPKLPADAVRNGTGLSDDDIVEAVDELERDGLVHRYQVMSMDGLGFHLLAPEAGLFEVFDPLFGEGDPTADASVLALALLDSGEQAGATMALAERLGWTARRANPALEWLIARDLVLAAKELDPVWCARWVHRKPGLMTFARRGSR